MRAWSLIGLLIALAIVALLARRQFGETAAGAAATATPATTAPAVNTPAQGRQFEQQFKQSLDDAMQQRTQVPEEAR